MEKSYTNETRLYKRIDGEWKADIVVHLTHPDEKAPSIGKCRFAALQIGNGGYVVYDRLLCRIVNGVFSGGEFGLESTLGVARLYNEGNGSPDMSPNGDALGLTYPDPVVYKKDEENEY